MAMPVGVMSCISVSKRSYEVFPAYACCQYESHMINEMLTKSEDSQQLQ